MEKHDKRTRGEDTETPKGIKKKEYQETEPPSNVGSGEFQFAGSHIPCLEQPITWRDPNLMLSPHPKQKSILGNDFLFYEILPLLPLKSLFRFKLVCREWHKVISTDSIFHHCQSRRCLTGPPTLLYRGPADNYLLLDPSLKSFSVPSMDLRASTNGLLCGTYKSRHGKHNFFVWNPFTKDLVTIPDPCKLQYVPCELQHVSLAFEPSTNNPHFTLVSPCITGSHLKPNATIVYFAVYSSVTGKWRASNARIYREAYDTFWPKINARSVYVGGKLHWKIPGDVFWLNIEEDSGGIVAIPKWDAEYPHGEIGDCNGELSYTRISPENIEIWILRSNEKSEFEWVQKYWLRLTVMFSNCVEQMPTCCSDAVSQLLSKNADLMRRPSRKKKSEIAMYRRPLPFEGGEVLFWVLHGTEGAIFCYNMTTGVVRVVHNSRMERSGCLFSHRCSLASVPRPCGIQAN